MATYGSAAGVQALVPAVGTLTTSTTPTLAQATAWLTEGHAVINRAISGAGYTAPIAAIADLYPELTALNDLYAAAYVLRSRAIDSASGDTEERSEVWLADFWRRLGYLVASDLSLGGAIPLPTATPSRRRRIRTLQMRKVDGYSRGNTDETWEVQQGEYTGYTAPSE